MLYRRCECGEVFGVRYPSIKKTFCSYSCASRARCRDRDTTGSANPNWRGGKATHPLYDVYMDMISRCSRPSHARYADYGGRGITVCSRWREDFWLYVADMGDRPSQFHSIDRRDNDGPYSPANCRWANAVEQRNNRRPQLRRPGRDPLSGRWISAEGATE